MEIRKDASMVVEGFTRHRAFDEMQTDQLERYRAYVSELDFSPEQLIEFVFPLLSRCNRFTETGNPILAIEAFLIAHKAGFYPPMPILNWLAEAFEQFHAANGKEGIEKILGLKRDRGQTPPFKELLVQDVEDMLMWDVWKLKKIFGLSTPRAAEMVAGRLKATADWDKSGWNLRTYTAATIEDRYAKHWSKIFAQLPSNAVERVGLLSEKEKREYLALFPEYTIPHGVK